MAGMAGIMRILLPSALLRAPALLCASALQEKHPTGYPDTPLLPGTKWHVHDAGVHRSLLPSLAIPCLARDIEVRRSALTTDLSRTRTFHGHLARCGRERNQPQRANVLVSLMPRRGIEPLRA